MKARGFSAIAITAPKCDANVGGALRAAACYGADLVVLSGHRYRAQATDTTKAWRHIPVIHNVADVFDAIPFDTVPIAVDLVDGAKDLPSFVHPERAFYIFGPEDGTLGKKVLDRCAFRLMVPTRYCMNLAASVNVILYDRLAKEVCPVPKYKSALRKIAASEPWSGRAPLAEIAKRALAQPAPQQGSEGVPAPSRPAASSIGVTSHVHTMTEPHETCPPSPPREFAP